MIAALESDPGLRDEYQFWTFRYATGDPIPYSACLLRRSLEEARRRFDPEKTDSSFDRMVLVGHSMGGLLAKMMVVESGTRLWREVSDRPFEQLVGRARGSQPLRPGPPGQAAARGAPRRLHRHAAPRKQAQPGLAAQLGHAAGDGTEPLRSAHDRLVARNNPGFFKDDFRKGLPTSIEELEWETPFLRSLRDLAAAPDVKFHSIIAVRGDVCRRRTRRWAGQLCKAHLEGASSEVVISAGHLCQDHPDAIREVRRVLLEHRGYEVVAGTSGAAACEVPERGTRACRSAQSLESRRFAAISEVYSANGRQTIGHRLAAVVVGTARIGGSSTDSTSGRCRGRRGSSRRAVSAARGSAEW